MKHIKIKLEQSIDLNNNGENSAQLDLIFGLVELFLHILSCLVNVSLHTENRPCNLPGSALKVPVGGGGWWVVVIE